MINPWTAPPAMARGNPDTSLRLMGTELWLAYRIARDPDHYAVIRFSEVEKHEFGPPDEDHLYEHPLFPYGLEAYHFHKVLPPTLNRRVAAARLRRWVITFPHATLDVTARRAALIVRAIAARDAEGALAAATA